MGLNVEGILNRRSVLLCQGFLCELPIWLLAKSISINTEIARRRIQDTKLIFVRLELKAHS